MTATTEGVFDPKTKRLLTTLGILLLAGFIMPIYFREFVFANIEALGEDKVPFGVKFQLIYPLIAGIGLLVIANQKRTLATAIFIILIAILPFIMMAGDSEFDKFFSAGKGIGMNADFISWASILSFIMVLGGAYSAGYLKQKKIGTYVTLGGVGIFILSLFVKGDMNQSIPLIDSLRMLISPEDYFYTYKVFGDEGEVIIRLTGIIFFTSLLLKIFACYAAFLMINEGETFIRFRKRVLQYWIASIVIVLVSALVVITFTAADKGGEEAFLSVVMMMLKMIFWMGSLFALLPLALSELLVTIDSGAKFDLPPPIADAGKKITKDINETVSAVSGASEKTSEQTDKKEEQTKEEVKTPPVPPPLKSEGSKKEVDNSPQPKDTIQKLTDLKKMFDNGLITQEEYDMVRKDILKNMG